MSIEIRAQVNLSESGFGYESFDVTKDCQYLMESGGKKNMGMNQNYILLKEKIGGRGASEKTAKLIFDSIRNNNFKN